MPVGAIPFPFGICRICKDKATGLHYGVATCEGCKGFFKRSIGKGEGFKCYFGGGCDVNPKTRSRCKACRYKRCMETGMSVEGVRMGRIPNTEKEKILEVFHQSGSDFNNHELLVKQTENGNYSFKLTPTSATTPSTSSPTQDAHADIPTHVTCSKTDTDICVNYRPDKSAFPNDSGVKQNLYAQPNCTQTLHHSSMGLHNCQSANYTSFDSHNSFDMLENDCSANKKQKGEMPDETDCGMFAVNHHSENEPAAPCFSTNRKIADEMVHEQKMKCDFIEDSESVSYCENPFSDTFETGPKTCGDFPVEKMASGKQKDLQHGWQSGSVMSHHHQNGPKQISNSFIYPQSNRVHPINGYVTDYSKPPGPQTNSMYKRTTSFHNEEQLSNNSDNSNDKEVHNIVQKDKLVFNRVSGFCSQDYGENALQNNIRSVSKRSCFSPALVNVLIEQVLDSRNGVSVIAEKIKQKYKQGNLSQGCIESLSKRMIEFTSKNSKKQRVCNENVSIQEEFDSKADLESLLQVNSSDVDDFLREVERQRDLHNFSSNGRQGCDSFDQDRQTNENAFFFDRKYNPDAGISCSTNRPSQQGSEFVPHRQESQISYKNVNYNEDVTSSALSEEEEQKRRKMGLILDGINLGMKILNRLKPENREKIRQMKLGQLKIRRTGDSDAEVEDTYKKIIQGIPDLNERILGFCDSVPEFCDVKKVDRDTLMKRAYYDIWMLSHADYFENGESLMILPTGEIYSEKTMRKILNDNMVDTIFKFAEKLNALQLTDMEIAILCAARLTASDDLELEEREPVNKLHSLILDAFAYEMKQNHPTNHARLLIDTFRLMPLLETVNRIQREIIAKYSVNKFDGEDSSNQA